MKKINKITLKGQTIYQLVYKGLEASVCPEDGMNIHHISYNGTTVVDVDPLRVRNKALYGTPILYPTPNRVKDNQFIYKNEKFEAQMHGVVKGERFQVVEIKEMDEEVCIVGRLSFEKGSELYQKFPFVSILDIKITLSENKITYEYQIENKDCKELPYGFAIHPFFQNIDGCVKIEAKAESVMEMTEEKIPTGVCQDILDTEFDLSKPKLVSNLSLDHVYTQLGYPNAQLHYKDFKISLNGTKEFSHLVVFTPQGQSFFCIENQTCSTDAHNLYHKGFKEESGLMIIKPEESHSAQIEFEFKTNGSNQI